MLTGIYFGSKYFGTSFFGAPNGDRTYALTGFELTSFYGTLGQDVEIVLHGEEAIGQFGKEHTYTLEGFSIAGEYGTLTPEIEYVLTGLEATSAYGTLFTDAANVEALVGFEATSEIGTLVPEISFPYLIGLESNTQFGSLQAESGDIVSLVGHQISSNLGNTTTDLNWTLSGRSSTGSLGNFTKSTVVPLTGLEGTTRLGNFVIGNKSITITWTASTDPGVTGYYVYMDTVPRGNDNYQLYTYQVDVSGRTTTSYVWTGLLPDTTYYFNISSHGSGGHDLFESELLGEISFLTASGETSVPLTGVSSTSSIGTLTSSNIKALTGLQGLSERGTLSPAGDGSASLAGLQVGGQLGSLSSARIFSLTGYGLTSSYNTVTVEYPYTLYGHEIGTDIGDFISDTTITLTGIEASAVGGFLTTTDETMVALTGVSASTEIGSVGSVFDKSLTGRSVTGYRGTIGLMLDGVPITPGLTLTEEDIDAIISALKIDPSTLTLQKFLALK